MQPTPSRLSAEVEYFTERDEAADAAYYRRERASNRVTLDDVIEQLATLPEAKKIELMNAYGADSEFTWIWVTAFSDAFETATDLRVAQGD